MSLRVQMRDFGRSQKIVKVGVRQLRRHSHCRDIAAVNQSLLGRNGPHETAVEILRAEGAEGGGRVLQDGARVQQSLIEAKSVDERFQCLAHRAPGRHGIDLSVDVGIAIVGRSDVGAHGSDATAVHFQQQSACIANADA